MTSKFRVGLKFFGMFIGGVGVLLMLIFAVLQVHGFEREVNDPEQLKRPNSRWLRYGETVIHYQDHGKASNPAVILIGGTGAWSENWTMVVPSLLKQNFRIIAIDLPPFGLSASNDAGEHGVYGRDQQAARVLAVIKEAGIRSYALVGHSFGGRATIEVAVQSGKVLTGLTLIDVALGFPVEENAAIGPPPQFVKSVTGISAVTAGVARILTHPYFFPDLVRGFVSVRESVTPSIVRAYSLPLKLKGTSKRYGEWAGEFISSDEKPISEQLEILAKITVPVQIIWGETDSITPLWQGRKLQSALPKAVLTIIPGVGHIPQIEAKKEFLEILVKYHRSIK